MANKNPAAVALGKMRSARKAAASARNIRKATRARLRDWTPEERSEQARQAARARWQAARRATPGTDRAR